MRRPSPTPRSHNDLHSPPLLWRVKRLGQVTDSSATQSEGAPGQTYSHWNSVIVILRDHRGQHSLVPERGAPWRTDQLRHSSIPIFIWTLQIGLEDSKMDALGYLHTLRLRLRPEAGTPPHCPTYHGPGVQPDRVSTTGLSTQPLPCAQTKTVLTSHSLSGCARIGPRRKQRTQPEGSHKDQLKITLLSSMRRSLQRSQILREI